MKASLRHETDLVGTGNSLETKRMFVKYFDKLLTIVLMFFMLLIIYFPKFKQ